MPTSNGRFGAPQKWGEGGPPLFVKSIPLIWNLTQIYLDIRSLWKYNICLPQAPPSCWRQQSLTIKKLFLVNGTYFWNVMLYFNLIILYPKCVFKVNIGGLTIFKVFSWFIDKICSFFTPFNNDVKVVLQWPQGAKKSCPSCGGSPLYETLKLSYLFVVPGFEKFSFP